MSNADLVAEFHRAVGESVPAGPTLPDLATLDLRETLLREEFAEVLEQVALLRARVVAGQEASEDAGLADIARLAHELADLLYVTYGALAALGVPADRVFAEVHAANLAKASGPRRADGKQLRPEGWQPADVLGLLRSLP
ncbi:hypothetical protein DNL40_06260 [Xylanimonas oleitrophica]|uniref:Phosphoribosyl-ATP pyrophosphohydrolase n=1 Tax=Xylanimonas oleitrophica TaxID=2607479 RepID=A0A2W5XUG2_9MICO|nr:hypothetical protein [Xylanimonas oleitrophica]PZR53898.1 hypothetical protein DNL40_06260 [Xylanimonas oleitrophica]